MASSKPLDPVLLDDDVVSAQLRRDQRVGRSATRHATRSKDPAATRRRIALAAAHLFAVQGYATTSLESVARAAGVHVQTIYLAFGTKSAVLGAALQVAVAGDDDMDVSPAEWPWAKALVADPDPASQLRRLAAHRRQEAPRAGPLVAQAREAARSDAVVAALLANAHADEHHGILGLTEMIRTRGQLRHGLEPTVAADTVIAAASYESFDRLVGDRGWTPDRYERWLGDVLCALLLNHEFAPGTDDARPL